MATYYYNGKHVDGITDGACISCPNCKRYNAMLYSRGCNQPSDDFVLKCRDCGAEVIVMQEPALTARPKRIYEFEIEAVGVGVVDSVEVSAESQIVALEKVRLWTRESNSMTGRDDAVREKPIWISDFYVS